MVEWTSNTTLDNTVSDSAKDLPKEEFILNESIIMDLKDTYVGTQGMKFELQNKDKIDLSHKQYFAVCLKEESIANVIEGTNPFTEEYTKFYSELLFEPEKKNGLGSIVDKFKAVKLPEEDTNFFNDLDIIKSYIGGNIVPNIAEKVDKVLEHRESYLKILPTQERESRMNAKEVKGRIIITRYNNALSDLVEFAKKNSGTTHMCPVIDAFIEDTTSMLKDFNSDIPYDNKKIIFNFLYGEYSNIIHNGSAQDSYKAMQDFNNLHKRLFNTDMKMVDVTFGDDGCSYEIANTPYTIN